MTKELKSCPFCGDIDGVLLEKSYDDCGRHIGWEIGCWNAHCPVQPEIWDDEKEIAIKAWNTRIGEEEI